MEKYADLCSTIRDIDNLLKHLVTKNILKIEDEVRIDAISVPSEKVKSLLHLIEGPLRSGDTQAFYTLLGIMKECGVEATKSLAIEIIRCLGIKGKFTVWCI